MHARTTEQQSSSEFLRFTRSMTWWFEVSHKHLSNLCPQQAQPVATAISKANVALRLGSDHCTIIQEFLVVIAAIHVGIKDCLQYPNRTTATKNARRLGLAIQDMAAKLGC